MIDFCRGPTARSPRISASFSRLAARSSMLASRSLMSASLSRAVSILSSCLTRYSWKPLVSPSAAKFLQLGQRRSSARCVACKRLASRSCWRKLTPRQLRDVPLQLHALLQLLAVSELSASLSTRSIRSSFVARFSSRAMRELLRFRSLRRRVLFSSVGGATAFLSPRFAL